MIYAAETYEKVRKLLGQMWMEQAGGKKVEYRVSRYKSKRPVYSVEGNGGEVYLAGDGVFELEDKGFDIGVQKEKEVVVEFTRFRARRAGERRAGGHSTEQGGEAPCMEVDAGAVVCSGKKVGTLLVPDAPQGVDVLSSVLKKFVRISTVQNSGKGLERVLVDVLISGEVL